MKEEKQLPNNIEAEQGVLGSILIDPEALTRVVGTLLAQHFYRHSHQLIYEAMLELYARQESVDLLTVCDTLLVKEQLEQVGGPGSITSLVNGVPTSGNAEAYATIVVRKAVLRALIRLGGEIVSRAFAEDEEVVSWAERALHQIGQGKTGSPVISHVDALSAYWKVMESLHTEHTRGALTGVPTGYRKLDTLLGGWRKSKLYLVAARPGFGKTALGLNLAYEAARRGCQVLFYSLEMEVGELMQRLLSLASHIDSTLLRDGRLGEEEWERAERGMRHLLDLPGRILFDDTPRNDSAAMASKARKQQRETGCDLVIVDYIQLATTGEQDARKLENRRLEVEQVSREMKALARELEVPVIALAQLNRDVEGRAGRMPQLSDLREAGGLEQDADAILFIWRDPAISKQATEYEVSLLIEKHRQGPTGLVPLRFVGWETRFYPVEEVSQ